MSKSFLITGATGLIGTHLIKELQRRNDSIIVISTNSKSAEHKLPGVNKIVTWDDYLSLTNENIDVIINLAGRNIGDRRWDKEFKKEIYDSRILSTGKIINLISRMSCKPRVLINASGVDYYGKRDDENIYEDSKPGNDFMASLCADWEAEAKKAEAFGVRVVMIRAGFVIAKEAESVRRLVMPFRFFAGGTIGSGKQFMSWIHIDDVVGIYIFSAVHENITGPVNAAAPNPERMKNFCRIIGKVLHRPAVISVPAFAVKLAAGEVAHLILNGRKALPRKISEAGFIFKFDNALAAWIDIIK